MVVLGPIGTIRELGTTTARPATGPSSRRPARAGCACGASWPTLMPDGERLRAAHHRLARRADRARAPRRAAGSLLTLYRFPTWANGTAALTPDGARGDHARSQGLGRVAAHERQVAAVPLSGRRLVRQRLGRLRRPDRVALQRAATRRARRSTRRSKCSRSPTSRTCSGGHNRARARRGRGTGSGPLDVQDVLVRMFATAKTIVAQYGEPMLAGPGSADAIGDTAAAHGLRNARDRLLAALAAAGFERRLALRLDASQLHGRHVRPGAGARRRRRATTARRLRRRHAAPA